MNIKRGDIYWIEQNKYRPAVGSVQKPGRPGIVVSNDSNNTYSLTLEIVYLTGKPKKPIPTHCTINSTTKPSTALCEQIQTISREQIREYIGTCSKEEMAEIDRCITISLGLTKPVENIIDPERKIPVIQPVEGIFDPLMHIRNLEKDLAASNARAKLLQQMYDNLLILTMSQE